MSTKLHTQISKILERAASSGVNLSSDVAREQLATEITTAVKTISEQNQELLVETKRSRLNAYIG